MLKVAVSSCCFCSSKYDYWVDSSFSRNFGPFHCLEAADVEMAVPSIFRIGNSRISYCSSNFSRLLITKTQERIQGEGNGKFPSPRIHFLVQKTLWKINYMINLKNFRISSPRPSALVKVSLNKFPISSPKTWSWISARQKNL